MALLTGAIPVLRSVAFGVLFGFADAETKAGLVDATAPFAVCVFALLALKAPLWGGSALVLLSVAVSVASAVSRSLPVTMASIFWLHLPVCVAGLLILASGLFRRGVSADSRFPRGRGEWNWSAAGFAIAILAGVWMTWFALGSTLSLISGGSTSSVLVAVAWGTVLMLMAAILSARRLRVVSGALLVTASLPPLAVGLNVTSPFFRILPLRPNMLYAAAAVGLAICLPIFLAGVITLAHRRTETAVAPLDARKAAPSS